MDTLIYSILLAFVVSLVLGPIVIPLLHKLKFGQQVRDDGPKQHLKKSGTPTMGGIMMLLAMAVPLRCSAAAAWSFVHGGGGNGGFGLIGFLDDFLKIRHKRSLGLRALPEDHRSAGGVTGACAVGLPRTARRFHAVHSLF